MSVKSDTDPGPRHRPRGRGPRHAGGGLAGHRHRARHLVLVRARPRSTASVRDAWSSGRAMAEQGTVTRSEPPHRFVYVTRAGTERQLAFEWLVEARDGGTLRRPPGQRRLRHRARTGTASTTPCTRAGSCSSRTCGSCGGTSPGRPAARSSSTAAREGGRDAAWAALSGGLGLGRRRRGRPRGDGRRRRPAARRDGGAGRAGHGHAAARRAHGRASLFVAAEGTGDSIWTSIYVYLFGDGATRGVGRAGAGHARVHGRALPVPGPGVVGLRGLAAQQRLQAWQVPGAEGRQRGVLDLVGDRRPPGLRAPAAQSAGRRAADVGHDGQLGGGRERLDDLGGHRLASAPGRPAGCAGRRAGPGRARRPGAARPASPAPRPARSPRRRAVRALRRAPVEAARRVGVRRLGAPAGGGEVAVDVDAGAVLAGARQHAVGVGAGQQRPPATPPPAPAPAGGGPAAASRAPRRATRPQQAVERTAPARQEGAQRQPAAGAADLLHAPAVEHAAQGTVA